MNARLFIMVVSLIQIAFYVFESIVIELQRKKPLPLEVSDIYEKERYKTYLSYAKDNRKLSIVIKIVSFILLYVLTYSTVYTTIDKIAGGNVYIIYFLTFALYTLVESVETYCLKYYDTFKIEAKYGLNKKDFKEFNREFILNLVSEILLSSALALLIIFVGEHLPKWTNNFTMSYFEVLFVCLFLLIIFGLFIVGANFFSIYIMKKQYTFTPLEEGELKSKIEAMQEGVKKKVNHIYVYNESKKSTSKNAFLLRFLWIREFGIADNFLEENAQEELLAVLSHEIGHLKHKKNWIDYLQYGFIVIFFLLFVYLLSDVDLALDVLDWVKESFNIHDNNYYINMNIFMLFASPIFFLFGIYRNFNIRTQEYEADEEAVKNGYGEALISTFKKLSKDELVNVNPSPIIEFLEYDHPGMYRRIKAIKDAMKGR